MFSITLLQMPKGADVCVIIATTAATAFIAGVDAEALVTVAVAVVITCVTVAGVFVFTHIIAVTGDKNVAVPFSPLKRLVVASKKKNMEPNLHFSTLKLFSSVNF